MEIQILNGHGYKPRVYKNVKFPITVEAKPIKQGILKGWYAVKTKDLVALGWNLYMDESSDDWTEEFHPDQVNVIQ